MHQKLTTSHVSYASNEKRILHDITLEFNNGGIHAILGLNGSGKSTLLKMLSGIWFPTTGTISWNGIPIASMARKELSRTISMVPQGITPAFDFIVEDIVAMGRYVHNSRYWNNPDNKYVKEALTAVDAFPLRQRRIGCLSYGERQRVYIARALASQCPVLLLDEPTAGLDIRHQMDLCNLLHNLAESGKIVVISTHDLALAERYCQTVAILHQGHCMGHGPYQSVMGAKILEDIFGVSEAFPPKINYETPA